MLLVLSHSSRLCAREGELFNYKLVKLSPSPSFQVCNRQGTLVVRPDSGDPTEVVLEVLRRLESKFGSKENSKGFKVCIHRVPDEKVSSKYHSSNANIMKRL